MKMLDILKNLVAGRVFKGAAVSATTLVVAAAAFYFGAIDAETAREVCLLVMQ